MAAVLGQDLGHSKANAGSADATLRFAAPRMTHAIRIPAKLLGGRPESLFNMIIR